MTNTNDEYPHSIVYARTAQQHKTLKKVWHAITNNGLYKRLRASRLNPYHTFLSRAEAEDVKTAKELARAKNRGYILYKGTRISTELHCPVAEEFERYGNVIRGGEDVTSRIPRNREGKLDLMAEEPVVVAIVPIEGPSLVGHAAMQYKNRVVNRRSSMMDDEPLFKTYSREADYYFVYLSQLGIDPKRFEREMDKVNIRKSGKYNLFTNNCAGAVHSVFKNVGVRINLFGPDRLGLTLATPGNNPFGFGIENWCRRHGVHVHAKEMRDLYKYNNNLQKRNPLEIALIKSRYENFSRR